MKFTSSARFDREFGALPVDHRKKFLAAVPAFNAACNAVLTDPSANWPASLRIRPMVNARGIWEMTWSFSGPDGRATFEFIRIDGEPAIKWRRIGRHDIYEEP